jgi:hypothetical protein
VALAGRDIEQERKGGTARPGHHELVDHVRLPLAAP